MKYKVVWDNEHACGELPTVYSSIEEAVNAAREWKAEMVALDEDPEEATLVYSWEVIRIDPPILPLEKRQ